jgi:glycosyltransferase involved in cell wall biosynthesis
MRVGWLVDEGATVGGAELTQAEFRDAAPEHVEIVDCPPGGVVTDLDLYVIQNCVLYTTGDLEPIADKPRVKYWHDVGPHLQPGVKDSLADAKQLCCSPIQAEFMNLKDAICIPPPVDLSRFEQAAEKVNGNRKGAVSVASWRNYGKAPHKIGEWASQNGGIDVYGGGIFAPPGAQEVAYDHMPALLARYETFVFLPIVLEPFGRLVAEAWAAGCEVVTNNLVGARYWIENDPDAIESAADDFWREVLA